MSWEQLIFCSTSELLKKIVSSDDGNGLIMTLNPQAKLDKKQETAYNVSKDEKNGKQVSTTRYWYTK